MLSCLAKSSRVKAAIALAAIYAFCVLAPAAAFALAAKDHIAHCLTEDHGIAAPSHHGTVAHQHADGTTHQHQAASSHVHADGFVHEHSGDHASPAANGDKSPAAHCCGLFSVVGIPGDPTFSFGALRVAGPSVPRLQDALNGRGPERINRPPIA